MFLHILTDVLRNSILITGLVIIMMLMIEYINVQTQGRWSGKLQKSSFGQVVLGSVLGLIPGCMGGFATVSLYTHGVVGFGALVAMMIASSGDEAFVMLATVPRQALVITAVLFVLAIVVGVIVNFFTKGRSLHHSCPDDFQVHITDCHHEDAHGHCDHSGNCPHPSLHNLCHPSWQRIVMLVGVAAFIVCLVLGLFEHSHGSECTHGEAVEGHACVECCEGHTACCHGEACATHAGHSHGDGGLHLLDEYWINLVFAVLSLFVLYFLATSNEHFVKEHLWHHVICRHFIPIFCWTAGALLIISVGLNYLDMEPWIKDNVAMLILLAVLIGIIPESGPHMFFITLFASGLVPFSVLLASSISQDGHAGLPLLAEDKIGFLKAKLINVAVALVVGYGCYFIGF